MSTPDPKSIVPDESSPSQGVERQSGARHTSDSRTRARGLASFVESLLPGTRDRAQPPHRNGAPVEEAPELLDLLMGSPDAILVLDREGGEIIEASHRFSEWTGMAHDDLVGRTFLSLFAESEHRVARKLYSEDEPDTPYVLEVPSSQSTQPHLIEFTATASDLAGGRFFIVIGRDVGSRAITERYLRAERDRMNLIIRSMRDILIMLNSGGDIEYCNPAAEQAFEQYELPLICHRWISAFSRQDRTDLQGLTSAYEGQTLELPGNDDRAFLVTRSFIFDSGQKARIMLLAKEITDQRMMQKQNRQLEMELLRESKMAEIGMLSAGIAHNLRGPLTGIMGFCELLAMRYPDLKEVPQIHQQALLMNAIIANLMDKSRSEQETEPKDLMIEELLQTELRFLEANVFFRHNVEKQLEIESPLPLIHGVYSDFSQVIGNLLRNAIDAMYETERKVLTVRASKEERHLLVEVSDTGTGMSDEVRAKLFTPFFTTKPKASEAPLGAPSGTGLGLSHSRSILARYGAEIEVESAPGEGSTFAVRFPLHRKIAG